MIRITVILILLFFLSRGTALAAGQTGQLFVTSDKCLACHNSLITDTGRDVSIGSSWQSSMMAHSARDPYWQASVRREILDHPQDRRDIEDECSACHMPMTRYRAMVMGGKGGVFIHLPFPAGERTDRLAEDGVSCSMCHQITEERLGTVESFTAGFVVDTDLPLDRRPAFGPYDVDRGLTRIMRSAARLVPEQEQHIRDSALCGSCHTLYTRTRNQNGEIIGTLPEQMPYLEWLHSEYSRSRSCQSCHMPQLTAPTRITSVLGEPREDFSRHVFRGGNFLMPRIFQKYKAELGITATPRSLAENIAQTEANLTSDTARVAVQAARSADHLEVTVEITNLAGHKLPTAYPSRRAWLHLKACDSAGNIVFESGALNVDGSIQGNDNDRDRSLFEPHYDLINNQDQVQIYEPIMVDFAGNVTTGLLAAIRFIKDNRIIPAGFAKEKADKDIAVQGKALVDEDFKGGVDTVRYRFPVYQADGPFTVEANLWYQPIGFRWAKNLEGLQTKETDRFVSYFNSMSQTSALILAGDSVSVK